MHIRCCVELNGRAQSVGGNDGDLSCEPINRFPLSPVALINSLPPGPLEQLDATGKSFNYCAFCFRCVFLCCRCLAIAVVVVFHNIYIVLVDVVMISTSCHLFMMSRVFVMFSSAQRLFRSCLSCNVVIPTSGLCPAGCCFYAHAFLCALQLEMRGWLLPSGYRIMILLPLWK